MAAGAWIAVGGNYRTFLFADRWGALGAKIPLKAPREPRAWDAATITTICFRGRACGSPAWQQAGCTTPITLKILASLTSSAGDATFDTMEIHLPPDQEAHLAALAASAGRSPGEIVQEAVTLWEKRQMPPTPPKRTPQEAAARMLERRKLHPLPEGMTIRDLMTYGRDTSV